jgi:hypothetical protein
MTSVYTATNTMDLNLKQVQFMARNLGISHDPSMSKASLVTKIKAK